jgi:hypothetical protein
MKLINTYSQFILNETLKTHDIDTTIRIVNSELSLLNYNFNINKNQNNTISIILLNFRYLEAVELYLNNLKALLIDRHGWFPSKMIITNTSGMKNEYSYDDDILKRDSKYIDNVEIIFEAKFDIEETVPEKLYHLSVQEYESEVLKIGLVTKSKLSKHLDRIYVCSDIDLCYKLTPRMKLTYYQQKSLNSKNKINDKWIIYEINTNDLDVKLFKDPNYDGGYYIIDNIDSVRIEIVDKEN